MGDAGFFAFMWRFGAPVQARREIDAQKGLPGWDFSF
jgi:hypothetical protein